jgi:hypothetical protein
MCFLLIVSWREKLNKILKKKATWNQRDWQLSRRFISRWGGWKPCDIWVWTRHCYCNFPHRFLFSYCVGICSLYFSKRLFLVWSVIRFFSIIELSLVPYLKVSPFFLLTTLDYTCCLLLFWKSPLSRLGSSLMEFVDKKNKRKLELTLENVAYWIDLRTNASECSQFVCSGGTSASWVQCTRRWHANHRLWTSRRWKIPYRRAGTSCRGDNLKHTGVYSTWKLTSDPWDDDEDSAFRTNSVPG